ncbi:MAG: prepilin-type N-terminal cleavage/methylation domain-containing protein [Candidatus Falkowbacteria bacterium]|nr:prepilin-type N-terminal cleavage/methylation domain-containing protein [Candidatus Falkowbacteria bacterium]
MNLKSEKGFTLIELLVVIAIIGVLSTMAIIALGNARAKARDARRVADIKQISTALELYYSDYGYYPTIITPGNALASADGTKIYINNIPNNPSPRNDSGCGDNNYTYSSTPDNSNYSLNFCLGNNVNSTSAGVNSSSSSGFGTAPGLVGWWKFDEGSGTTAIDSSGNSNTGTWSGAGIHYSSGKTGIYAGQFNGINNINISNSSNLNNRSITVMGWIKITNTSNWMLILKNDYPNTGTYYIYSDGPGNGVRWTIFDSVRYDAVYSSDPVINTWNHYAGVANASLNSMTLYVNGVPRASTSNASVGISSANIVIGSFAGSYFTNGSIDDVRIYNRALSAAEILALYNSTK